MSTDCIADMLTKIRNAGSAGNEMVDIPASNVKKALAQILLDEGYIKSFENIEDKKQGIIRISLKYDKKNGLKTHVIEQIKRISKPGLRVYVKCGEIPTSIIPRHVAARGVPIISTSKGIMAASEAFKLGFGGELMAFVW